MNQNRLLFFIISILLMLQSLSCNRHYLQPSWNKDVVLFNPSDYGRPVDIATYSEISKELDLSTEEVDHSFINNTESFFDKEGQLKFKVLILPGGEPYRWFEAATGRGLDCEGVWNILKFVKSGGSVIGMCLCSSSLFVSDVEWLNPTLEQAQRGEWNRTNSWPGWFFHFCNVTPPFKGIVRGPQESNRPYPMTKFLPITMNPDNEIVQEANLPPVIHQIVVGSGSLIPNKDQPIDVVGWYPNGTIAIGIVPYGKGRIILSNPHPNITGHRADQWRIEVPMGNHAKRWGWTKQMMAEGKEVVKSNTDPDGPEPDWALAKSMLSYAYKTASDGLD
ncbi:hypothetical protein ACFL7E_08885 [Thermodesulfobacteriota bacterium]